MDLTNNITSIKLSLFNKFKGVKRQSGFTLLEIIIAITILGVIVSLIYPAYTGTYRNIDIAETQAEIYQMARVTLIRIIEDLESGYMPETSQNDQDNDENFTSLMGQNEEIDGRRADKLSFFSKSHINLDDPLDKEKNAKITYYPLLKENGSISLYRSDTPSNLGWPEEETEGLVICEGLYSISFTYMDKNEDSHDIWDESVMDSAKKFPSIVNITLEFIDKTNPEEPLTFSTAVFMPLAN